MVQILYSYCLISTGVRIICTNQTDKGKKTVVVSTDGHGSVKENISSVFGAKQVSSILEFQQEMASTDVLTEYGMPTLEISQDNYLFTIEGFISSCAHGQGRSATDRQFYFINSRPCDPAKVMKLVNEVYHYYNRHQSPFVVLNIHLKEGDVDINVTPDKRQILVNNEKIMLATIKTSMIKLYENIPSTYHMQNTSLNSPMNRSFDSSQGSRSPSVASPSTNSSGGRVSALTLKFGRKFSGSPASESSESPLSSPLAVGLKRSLSQNTANSSPSNKQPKLETFFKNKSLSSSNGSTDSPDSTQPSLNGDALDFVSQSNSEIERFDNSLDSVLEGIKVDDNGVVSVISAEDKENLPGEWKENGTATDPGVKGCRELDSLSEEKSGLLPSSAVDEVTPSSGNVTVGRGDQVDVECAEESSIGNNESNISSSVNGKPSQSESILSKFSFVLDSKTGKNSSAENNGRSGGSEGKGEVKSVLSRFSRPVTSPSASCKKVHSATNDFLSNLMARKSDKKKSVVENRTMEQMKVDEILVLDGEDDTKVPINEGDFDMAIESESSPQKSNKSKLVVCEEYNPEDYIAKRKSRCINFNLEYLKKKIAASEKRKENRSLMRKFHAKIAPGDNKSAEDELRKEISKDMFAKMEILGQFNLGFIIAKLGFDLFIVDQHATDEKYNFETLQQTCILQNQRLIIPQLLELTAVNESILLDNIEIFKKNGFEFKVDLEKRVGRRVNLTSMPFSRGWEFGREDIEELIFMLSDSPGVMCRPSRVRAMFASRSCRKSIMIGTALTKSQMQKLVVHMGEIEQPWNCPHGRPTMRHLVNLDMISSASETE